MQAPLAVEKKSGGRGKGPRFSRVTRSRSTEASSSPGQVQGCFRFLPGQAGGPGVAMQEAGDLVWLRWGLALPWPWRSRKRRASQVGAWQEGQDG